MAAVKSTASVLYKIDEFGKCKELGFDPQKLSSLPGMYVQRRFFFSGVFGGAFFCSSMIKKTCHTLIVFSDTYNIFSVHRSSMIPLQRLLWSCHIFCSRASTCSGVSLSVPPVYGGGCNVCVCVCVFCL